MITSLAGGFWAGYSYSRSRSTSEFQDYSDNRYQRDLLLAEIEELQSQVDSLQSTTTYSHEGWYNEQFRDTVALTQNAFQNLFAEFDDILGDDSIDEKSLRELETWVERTSVQSATVTFLDRNHFDLWDWTSDALELFEDFLEDLRAAAREGSDGNTTIPLDPDSVDKLEKIYDELEAFYEHVFPVDVLEEGTMWKTPHYDEMDTAFGMLSRFREDVAKAWPMCSKLSGSTENPPQDQALELMVEALGEEYVTEHIELAGVQYNDWEPDDWLTCVAYNYHIQVGDYTATRGVRFYFDKMNRLLSSSGVPPADNLMPFNVSREAAIDIALGQVTQRFLEVEAEIRFLKSSVNDVQVNRYIWHVSHYLTKKSAPSGSLIEVLVDLHSGEIIDVAAIGWTSTP